MGLPLIIFIRNHAARPHFAPYIQFYDSFIIISWNCEWGQDRVEEEKHTDFSRTLVLTTVNSFREINDPLFSSHLWVELNWN